MPFRGREEFRRSTVAKGACIMNWDQVEGQWKQRRGKAARNWGRLMNDELAATAGKHEQLVGILQEKYGIAKEQAARQVDRFKKLKKSNARLAKAHKSTRAKKKKSNRTTVKAETASKRRKRS